MKRISVEISSELDKQVRVIAAQLDMNRSEFTRQALEEKVKELIEQAGHDLESGQDACSIALGTEAPPSERTISPAAKR